MLEDFIKALISVIVMTSFIQSNKAQDSLIPSCSYIKDSYNPIEKRLESDQEVMLTDSLCNISRETDNCNSYSVMSNIEINVRNKSKYITENGTLYTLIDIAFVYESNPLSYKFLLKENTVGTCWSVEVFAEEYPIKIAIYNLPVSDFSEITATAVLTEEDDHHSCELPVNKEECSILKNSKLDFVAISNLQSVLLTINVSMIYKLKIELYSGDCNISCQGIQNNCTMRLQNSSAFDVIAKVKEINYFNLTPAFYCTRIGLLNNCCVIYTGPIRLNALSNTTAAISRDPVSDHTIRGKICAIVVCAVLSLLLLFIVKGILLNLLKNSQKLKQPVYQCSVSLVTETEIKRLVHDMKKTIEVYLVYTDDSKDLMHLMEQFRHLLITYVQRVWDPYSDDDIESCSENIALWIEKVMSKPKIRIIIVETERAVETEKLWIESKRELPRGDRNFLNKAFLYTLSNLKNDFHLKHDYSRIFVLRLNTSTTGSLNILSCTRYHMPENFENLIYDMSRYQSKTNGIDLQDFSRYILSSKEKDNFIQALCKYNSMNDYI